LVEVVGKEPASLSVTAGLPSLRPTVAQATRALLAAITQEPPPIELVPVSSACGRVTGRDVLCDRDIPECDKAAMDGYALIAEDTEGATESCPVLLEVVQTITAGTDPGRTRRISRGEAAAITTGAPLPPGADAVVKAEDCQLASNRVILTAAAKELENVASKGEDYRRGDTIVRGRCVVRPWHAAALACASVTSVPVLRQLRVGILSTGNELVDVGTAPGPGQTVNSNKPMLSSMLRAKGCLPINLGISPDKVGQIRRAIEEGLDSCEFVLTTGGSSIGKGDLDPEAIAGLDGHCFIARGLRLRPGGATGIALVHGRPVFILSGYPIAAFTAFEELVKPTINRVLGIQEDPVPTLRGRLEQRISNREGFRCYVRVKVEQADGCYKVVPLASKGAGLLSTLTKAQGIVIMDEGTAVREAGDEVEVRLLESVYRHEI